MAIWRAFAPCSRTTSRLQTDGGGKRPSATAPILGADAVVALHEQLARLFARVGSHLVRYGYINGLPGFVSLEGDGLVQTTALAVEDGRITAIYIVRNPDKLTRLEGAAVH